MYIFLWACVTKTLTGTSDYRHHVSQPPLYVGTRYHVQLPKTYNCHVRTSVDHVEDVVGGGGDAAIDVHSFPGASLCAPWTANRPNSSSSSSSPHGSQDAPSSSNCHMYAGQTRLSCWLVQLLNLCEPTSSESICGKATFRSSFPSTTTRIDMSLEQTQKVLRVFGVQQAQIVVSS
jgi:hypothetical protein